MTARHSRPRVDYFFTGLACLNVRVAEPLRHSPSIKGRRPPIGVRPLERGLGSLISRKGAKYATPQGDALWLAALRPSLRRCVEPTRRAFACLPASDPTQHLPFGQPAFALRPSHSTLRHWAFAVQPGEREDGSREGGWKPRQSDLGNTPAKFEFCRLGYNRFMTVRQILEEAKRLDPIERAELLEQLYATFEPADPSVDAAWSVEVEERLSAYRAGEIEAAPFEDVLDRINKGNRG